MDVAVQPIFLLSLPRSGSTLVQRVVASYPGVATASEPWILLPFLSVLHSSMPLATKWDGSVSRALNDFFEELPAGQDDYLRELRSFALRLYQEAAGPDARYFLDKTPPYHLVVEEIARLFPDAKLVFLWRNPLAVVASMAETIWAGRWQLHRSRGDLFHGLANLVSAYERHQSRAIGLRYESLVTGGYEDWQRLAAYLDLDFDPNSLSRFRDVALTGRLGDQSGTERYARLSTEPLQKWRETICNPMRKAWCERYLKWIGSDRLETMGYSLPELLGELEEVTPGYRRLGVDAVDVSESLVRELVRARLSHNTLASSWRLLLGGNPVNGSGGRSPSLNGREAPGDRRDPLAVPRKDSAYDEEAGGVGHRAGQ